MTNYISTRDAGREVRSFEDILLAGLAPDGGLYVPLDFPVLDQDIDPAAGYRDVAFRVMKPFVGSCVSEVNLRRIINETYAQPYFRDESIVPLKALYGRHFIMEQFNGPTLAFKDIALQLLGRFFDLVLKKRGQRITIIGATSGDTGSAAIEGCRHSEMADIFILHPKGRVSDVQRKQMTTVEVANVNNIAIKGSFDDCQNLVKAMFVDAEFRDKAQLSAVNSINWGRILAQIVYYVYVSAQFKAKGGGVPNFVVPTGNFGNVYAAYCARRMGVDLNLVVATNRNDILTRFFEMGAMISQGVVHTNAPSMDIEISSNFERYLFELTGQDAGAVVGLMGGYKETGSFTVPKDALEQARRDFCAQRASESEVVKTIRDVYEKTGYTLDPHTAVGFKVAQDFEDELKGPIVTLATAHPAKFPNVVEEATGVRPALPDFLSDLYEREERMDVLPNDLSAVKRHIEARSRAIIS